MREDDKQEREKKKTNKIRTKIKITVLNLIVDKKRGQYTPSYYISTLYSIN